MMTRILTALVLCTMAATAQASELFTCKLERGAGMYSVWMTEDEIQIDVPNFSRPDLDLFITRPVSQVRFGDLADGTPILQVPIGRAGLRLRIELRRKPVLSYRMYGFTMLHETCGEVISGLAVAPDAPLALP